ncbi:hypothetical protein BX661DRAFT_196646 [Kickxella alabastrina]|uniref:uncharacterized protein n=1 Tax=Kickxella alabastrina TaxID=61397 RepID=UPI0022203A42|nr:uncharacterized protein BX661DRAFT_196646 [Kickxella alabastrina]KAI7833449.1 hypothetical protein BX661DRAFT_196646 [Kickxella alabastrina]
MTTNSATSDATRKRALSESAQLHTPQSKAPKGTSALPYEEYEFISHENKFTAIEKQAKVLYNLWFVVKQPLNSFGHIVDVKNNPVYLEFSGSKKNGRVAVVSSHKFTVVSICPEGAIYDVLEAGNVSRVLTAYCSDEFLIMEDCGDSGYSSSQSYNSRSTVLELDDYNEYMKKTTSHFNIQRQTLNLIRDKLIHDDGSSEVASKLGMVKRFSEVLKMMSSTDFSDLPLEKPNNKPFFIDYSTVHILVEATVGSFRGNLPLEVLGQMAENITKIIYYMRHGAFLGIVTCVLYTELWFVMKQSLSKFDHFVDAVKTPRIGDIIKKEVGLQGRASYVVRTKFGENEAVLKLSWTHVDRHPEGGVYEVLEAGNVGDDILRYWLEYLIMEDCGEAGVLHCNISPENITWREKDTFVIGWGCARILPDIPEAVLKRVGESWDIVIDELLYTESKCNQGTGTECFKSVRVLDGHVKRRTLDDIESLLYIMLTGFLYIGPKRINMRAPIYQGIFAGLSALAKVGMVSIDNSYPGYLGVNDSCFNTDKNNDNVDDIDDDGDDGDKANCDGDNGGDEDDNDGHNNNDDCASSKLTVASVVKPTAQSATTTTGTTKPAACETPAATADSTSESLMEQLPTQPRLVNLRQRILPSDYHHRL